MLDPIEQRLYADGVPVALGSTGFRILLALVEKAETLIPKDELIARVWGSSVIGDNTLHVQITALRKVIGRNSIMTKQGRGYLFATPVRREQRPLPLSPDHQRGNLPPLWTSNAAEGPARLIGRKEELRDISQRLARTRLVTLTGPGGVGKTSLALHVAGASQEHFRDGVWLVELAALTDPDLVPGAVAAVLGIETGQSKAPLETLARQLARKSLLIVLDNCEHVVAMAALLSEALLRAATEVKILATSREALSCRGEEVFEVPSLALPADDLVPSEAQRGSAAVELFLERAKSADSKLQMSDEDICTVARICRRLDGLPLAIEIAAGWTGVLGLETLDAQLDGSLSARLRARSTAPARHSTLAATLEWGHGLLSPAEQVVLRRLSVFAGSFSMEMARYIAGDSELPKEQVFEAVVNLVRKSMLAVVPGPRVQHYRMLETTRAFMLEKFAACPDARPTRQRHLHYVLGELERAMSEWETAGDAVWVERYGPILNDLRSALDWTIDEKADDAIALAGAAWPLWRAMSLRPEGRASLGRAAALLRPGMPPMLEARFRGGLGDANLDTSVIEAYAHLLATAKLYRSLGETDDLGSTLVALAHAARALGRVDEAEMAIAEALDLLNGLGRQKSLARAYSALFILEATLGHFDAARAAGEKAARMCETIGADRTATVMTANMVELLLASGDIEGAIAAGRKAVSRFRDSFCSHAQGHVHGILSAAFTARGDIEEALVAARDAILLLRDEGALFWLFDHLALRAGLAGRFQDAARLSGYADAVHRNSNRPRERIGQDATGRLGRLLRDALPESERAQLHDEGAMLSEGQAITLALRS